MEEQHVKHWQQPAHLIQHKKIVNSHQQIRIVFGLD